MSRKLAREFCMKMLFQMSIHNDYSVQILENRNLEEEGIDEQQGEYVHKALSAVVEHMTNIDNLIEKYSKGWKLNRIAKVDLAILRLAVGEVLYLEDIPYRVSINEAIELGKKYGTDESPSFINGILGKFVKEEGLKEDE